MPNNEKNTEHELTRRSLLAGAAAAAALAAVAPAGLEAGEPVPKPRVSGRMPVGYVSHGSPLSALDTKRRGEWGAWAAMQAKPVAVLVLSAHFERSPVTIGATKTRPLFYDFRGFPRALYDVKYAAPGAPKLARRVERLLAPLGKVAHEPRRGHDHGTWVPLTGMYPRADVPVLSVSIPTHDPKKLYRLGRALRPLRDEGVFLLGSGAMTHNLRFRPKRGAKGPTWAKEFDAWAAQTLSRNDVDGLLDWEKKAPAARTNHPTVEHFVPLLFAAGARHDDDSVMFPLTGFDSVIASNRCVSFVPPAPAKK